MSDRGVNLGADVATSLRLGRVARQNSESTTCHLRWVFGMGSGYKMGVSDR